MAIAAGKFTLQPPSALTPTLGLDGTHPAFQVDVGFEPALYMVITAGLMSEDSWDTSGPIWGGIGVAHKSGIPGGNGLAPATALTEVWSATPLAAGFWSNSGVIWFRSSGGGGGPAFFLGDTNPTGFRIGYPFGFEGGYGTVCYYLAFESDGEAARVFGYNGALMPVSLGWEPSFIFSLGHGGGSPPGDIGAGNFSDFSVGIGGFDNQVSGLQIVQWLANGLFDTTSVEQLRFIDDGSGPQIVYGSDVVGQMVSNSEFSFGKTLTDISVNYGAGFPEAPDIRVGVHLLEGGVSANDSVTPNPVGTPLDVVTGFAPDAVVFLAPQDHHINGNLGEVPWGGRCLGFATEEFECCIAWGAYSHVGSVASFCTSAFSWISNFTSVQLSDPTNPNYGSTVLIPNGFRLNTLALPKLNKYMRWVAFGVDEDAPGFFRVVYR